MKSTKNADPNMRPNAEPTFPGHLRPSADGHALLVPCTNCGVWHTHGLADDERIGRLAWRGAHCRETDPRTGIPRPRLKGYYIVPTEHRYQSAWGRLPRNHMYSLSHRITPAYFRWRHEMLVREGLARHRGVRPGSVERAEVSAP